MATSLYLFWSVYSFISGKLTLVMLNKLRCYPTSNFQPIRLLDLCCWYKLTFLITNSADPDQLASEEANWSGSTLFAKAVYISRLSRIRLRYFISAQNDLLKVDKLATFDETSITEASLLLQTFVPTVILIIIYSVKLTGISVLILILWNNLCS